MAHYYGDGLNSTGGANVRIDALREKAIRMAKRDIIYGLESTDFDDEYVDVIRTRTAGKMRLTDEEAEYFVLRGVKSNKAYIGGGQKINVLTKKGKIIDIAIASDLPNIKAMRNIVKKYYLCYPKGLSLRDQWKGEWD